MRHHIGCYIKKKRKQRGITIKELAENLNVTERSIYRYQTGQNLPDLFIAVKLNELIGFDLEELRKEI